MADLLTENFFGEMQRCAYENGVLYQSEASGRQMFMYDPLNYQSRNDLPIGEFWRQPTDLRVDCRVAASVAHTYNRPVVGAEAFTTVDGGLRNAPFDFKALGDMAFCEGVNRFYIHRYCMQPWNVEPGITFSHFGINFDRTQTWWENGGKAWCDYLSSCQALLQAGVFVADVIH